MKTFLWRAFKNSMFALLIVALYIAYAISLIQLAYKYPTQFYWTVAGVYGMILLFAAPVLWGNTVRFYQRCVDEEKSKKAVQKMAAANDK